MGSMGGGGGGKSGNKNLDEINDIYEPMAQQGAGGFNMLGNLLGMGGAGASQEALQNYWDSSGGQFLLNQGLGDVNDKFHALGLGRSGAAMKAMEGYRQELASTKLDNYLGHLGRYSQLGLGAGGLMAQAGQYSKGAGGGAGGVLGGIGGLLSGLAAFPGISAREAKVKIERIGDWDGRGDGLGKYRFAYKWEPDTMLEGVMADEVAALRPKALGPIVRGYQSVNYAALESA